MTAPSVTNLYWRYMGCEAKANDPAVDDDERDEIVGGECDIVWQIIRDRSQGRLDIEHKLDLLAFLIAGGDLWTDSRDKALVQSIRRDARNIVEIRP